MPVSSSNGRLSVSLDGSANSLIVFDDKIKYAKIRIDELELLIKHWEKEKTRQEEKNKVE